MKAQSANRMAVAAAVALVAMGTSQPAQAAQNQGLEWQTSRKLNLTTLGRAARGPYKGPVLMVVQSACQWKSAMADLNSKKLLESGALPEPVVDWQRQSVVVVSLGQVPYGYNVEVREARRATGRMLLDVHVDYQSYENQLDDVTPMHMLVVEGKGMGRVVANYDLAVPGLVGSNHSPDCGQVVVGGVASMDAGTQTQQQPMTWGALKSMYR